MLIQSFPMLQGMGYTMCAGGFSGSIVGLVLGIGYCANAMRTHNHHPAPGGGDLTIKFIQIVTGGTVSGCILGIVAFQISEIAKKQLSSY